MSETWEALRDKRYEWLEDTNYFKSLEAYSLGGATIRSFEMTSGKQRVREFLKENSLDVPRDLGVSLREEGKNLSEIPQEN